MNESSLDERTAQDSVSVADILAMLWGVRWIVAALTLLPSTLFTVYIFLVPDVYRAEVLVSPTADSTSSPLGALASQYGGILGLAGVNIGPNSGDKAVIGLEILESRQFLGRFIERHNVAVPLFAAKGWDADEERLLIDASVFDEATKTWTRSVRPPRSPEPSKQEAIEEFSEILDVRKDGETALVTISVEHVSPVLAQRWATLLVDDLNSDIREQDVTEAERAIEYLETQVQLTSIADVKTVFYELIEEQLKTVMLANVSDEYFLKTIDPAVVPEESIKPKRAILIPMFILVVFMLVCIAFIVRAFMLAPQHISPRDS